MKAVKSECTAAVNGVSLRSGMTHRPLRDQASTNALQQHKEKAFIIPIIIRSTTRYSPRQNTPLLYLFDIIHI